MAVGALARLSVSTALAYRADLAFDVGSGVLKAVGRVAPLFAIFGAAEVVGGWTLEGAMAVMGLFLVVMGIQGAFVEPNLGAAVEGIRSGSLDLWLMLPVDAQLLVSARRVAPGALVDLPFGVAMVAMAAGAMRSGVGDILAATWLLACGTAALNGVWWLAICASFVFVRVDNLRFLIWSIADGGRWPSDVFHPAARVLLTWVVPILVATSWPAAALSGDWTVGTLATGGLVATLLLGGSRWVWLRSLASYTSAGG